MGVAEARISIAQMGNGGVKAVIVIERDFLARWDSEGGGV
jgi:hypothetical protein